MQVVVIGAGRMGAIRTEDLAADPRVSEIVVVNRSDEKAQSLARQFGVTARPWDELDSLRPDAYVVAVATDAHSSLLTSLLERQVPVLCEKPIALTLRETDEVITSTRLHGSDLMVGFQRRFDPGIRRAHDLAVSGDLGTLYSLQLLSHDRTPSPREFIAGSGGIFRDLHVHDFDLVRWICGAEVETVYATKAVRSQWQYAEFGDADVCQMHLMTSTGVQVAVSGTRHHALGHEVRMEIHGSGDSVAAGLNPRTPLHALDGDLDEALALDVNVRPYTGFVDRFRDAFRHETAAFLGLVAGEHANPCPPEDARESLRIAVACEESIRRGTVVRVADITSESD
jgi:myo-inositol 2-dehydrogenase / D-chiro-inositol 1-dehydrogenase